MTKPQQKALQKTNDYTSHERNILKNPVKNVTKNKINIKSQQKALQKMTALKAAIDVSFNRGGRGAFADRRHMIFKPFMVVFNVVSIQRKEV